jgi:Heavy metal binding domain
MLKRVVVAFVLVLSGNDTFSQCCAGGSGSPIAGGASQGVLLERQIELSTNFQFINTNKFYKKDAPAPDSLRTFDSFSSQYEYFRLAYGVTKNFTMSIESGYYFNKKETGLHGDPLSTYEAKGIGDLIIFPRYDAINWTEEKTRTEVTLGLGFKIPLGSYNDSIGIKPEFPAFPGQVIYAVKPQAVQPSSGAHDIIFYTFLYRGYTDKNFKIFANAMYIKKGWNPNGEKLGDFASVGLFAGKSFFDHLGVTLQVRYEWMDTMKINENILLYGKPSTYDPDATGYKKVFITPQVSYTKGKFTIYAMSEFPVYQFLNTNPYYTQVGSEHLTTVGISFRFFAVNGLKNLKGTGKYYCPMHPEEVSDSPGKCPKCKMDLEKSK